MKSINDTPSEKWSLMRLGQFCIQRHQRMAVDVWLVGKAMTLAKERCKKESKSFTDWKREHKFSNATASRYMGLYRKYESDEAFERLRTVGILQALTEAGLEAPRERKPRQPAAKRSAAGRKKPGVTNGGKPSWAVNSPDAPASGQNGTGIVEMRSRNECLEEELRRAVPWQVNQLKEKVVTLLDVDVQTLRAAWPTGKRQRQQIGADIDALIELLPRLVATLREEPVAEPAVSRRKTSHRKAA
ncbi:MAG: hypothetical protein ABSF26_02745 [Thermoguttaceae bacterium]|jgi:hypothetical protein